jgi:hypothetical protein
MRIGGFQQEIVFKGLQFVAPKLGWQLKFAHPIFHELFPTCILVDMYILGLLEKTAEVTLNPQHFQLQAIQTNYLQTSQFL